MNEFLKTAGVTNVYKNPSFEQRKWQCFGEDLPQGLCSLIVFKKLIIYRLETSNTW
jgi:hypothetical protein